MENQSRQSANEAVIAQGCIQHLAREIELLEQFVQISNSIFDNVGVPVTTENNEGDLVTSLSGQSRELAADRVRLTNDIAAFLAIPVAQVTIRRLLLSITGEDSQIISKQRERLLELETAIQNHNRTNTFLIRQSMDLYRRIAIELTDQKPIAPTYSSTGELTANGSANFLQTDC